MFGSNLMFPYAIFTQMLSINPVCLSSYFELLLQNKYVGHYTIAFQADSCCCTSWGTVAVVFS